MPWWAIVLLLIAAVVAISGFTRESTTNQKTEIKDGTIITKEITCTRIRTLWTTTYYVNRTKVDKETYEKALAQIS